MEESKSVFKQYRNLVIFAVFMCVMVNLTTGIQNVWSVLSHAMIADYGWTTVQATRPYTLITVCSGLFSIVAGRWGDKHGHRWPMYFGAACMGCGLLLSSMHQNPWLMCLTAGCLLGFSSSSMTCNTAGNAMQWVPYSRKGLATGIVTCGFAVSSMYMTPLINMLHGNFGIIGTFRIMGVLALIIPILLITFVPDSRSKKYKDISMKISAPDPQAGVTEDHSKYKNSLTPNQALKTKEFWLCWCMYLFPNLGGQVFLSQAVTIAGVQAPEWTNPSILVVLIAMFNFIGRLSVPALADKFGAMTVTRFTQGICGINFLLFLLYRSPALLIIGCCVLGFTFGSNIPMLWNWLTNVFGTKYASSLQGMGTTAWAVGGIAGPMFAAYMMDATGSYNVAFMVVGLLCFVGVVMSLFMKNNYDKEGAKQKAI